MSKRYNVHLPRQRLRELLAQGVPPAWVRWGTRVTGFRDSSEEIQVLLDDGSEVAADLLVGSDGIHSAVRRQLLGEEAADSKHYLGVLVVLGMAPCAHPLVRERVWQMVDGTTRLFAMPFTVNPDVTFWQLSFPLPEAEAHAIAKDPQRLSQEVLQRCGTWHAPLPELLRNTNLADITAYPVYDRDPLLEPIHKPLAETGPRATIIGDAAHTMSPFKGQGANQALLDATNLATRLKRALRVAEKQQLPRLPRADLCLLLSQFETEMIQRSRGKVIGSREAAIRLHRPLVLDSSDDTDDEVLSTRRLPRAAINALAAANIGAWTGDSLDALVIHTLQANRIQLKDEKPEPERPRKRCKVNDADADAAKPAPPEEQPS